MISRISFSIPLFLGLALLGFGGCEQRQPSSNPPPASNTAPNADNTARNKSDSEPDRKTPIDQSNSADAIRITAEIRKAIINDSTMSMTAHNCKVITQDGGVVTLRGPVESQNEKDAIETIAKSVAGVTRVDNQLEVKSK